MSTNITALKGKGTPPSADLALDVITENVRPGDAVPNTTIQFSIPPSVYKAFSDEAGRVHGFNKGAKSKLFLQLWQAYLKTKA